MSDLQDRTFFVVTFAVDEPIVTGQQPRLMHVPALVTDWQTAADKAAVYLENFQDTPEGKKAKEAELAAGRTTDLKLKLQSIMLGGTILL